MSLPVHHPLAPIRPASLAEAVERARHPRNPATVQLQAHRDELLRLRRAGESVETLVGAMRLMGIEIGRETMRRWLQREFGRRPAGRRKSQPVNEAGKPADSAIVAPLTNTGIPAKQAVTAPELPPGRPSWQGNGPRIARDDY